PAPGRQRSVSQVVRGRGDAPLQAPALPERRASEDVVRDDPARDLSGSEDRAPRGWLRGELRRALGRSAGGLRRDGEEHSARQAGGRAPGAPGDPIPRAEVMPPPSQFGGFSPRSMTSGSTLGS